MYLWSGDGKAGEVRNGALLWALVFGLIGWGVVWAFLRGVEFCFAAVEAGWRP